jgi:glycerophosphoryl diester phosphodiesterase
VVEKTLAQLRRCRADVLGVPGSGLPTRAVADPSVGVPTLADVLALARRTGSEIVPEIKNYPTDSDYDPTLAFAQAVTDALGAGGLPPARIIVQSFTTENLDVVQARLPAAQTSLLALTSGNDAAIPLAVARGYTWVSPQWPVDAAYVAAAHAGGRRVVPYTIDTADQMAAAGATGVDAEITNDPTRARATLGLGFPARRALSVEVSDTSIAVRRGQATVRLRCRARASATCVGNLLLTVRGRGVAGRAQYVVPGGRTQPVKLGVRRGATGPGTAAVSVFDERGLAVVGRQSITLG